ncbi:MAG: ParA family protein [Lachnospiraceae bacterium]|nr:ParA family protein [Lachnospiraceae bacterium]
MGRIIAVANQKGGVGKTTSVINLSAALGEAGKKVLTVDMDPQGNSSSGLGLDKNKLEKTVYQLMIGKCGLSDCSYPSSAKNVTVVPATVHLAGAEVELFGQAQSRAILKTALDSVRKDYDFILIDCPPSLNLLTINAMVAADSVMIPIQCEYYALEGLSQLMYTIGLVQKSLNPALKVDGVVFTMFDARTNLSVEVIENVKSYFKEHIYRSVIPRNVRLAEAPSHGLPITRYDSRSSGAESYRKLAKEVIKNKIEGIG